MTLEQFEERDGTIDEWMLIEGGTPVIVMPLTTRDEVIAIEQYRHAAYGPVLELPGGLLDGTDYDPYVAAARELEEETGYRSERSKMMMLGHERGIWFDPCCFKERFLACCIKDCELHRPAGIVTMDALLTPPVVVPTAKHVTVHRFSIYDWYRMLTLGKCIDSKTIAVSMMALAAMTTDQRNQALEALA